MGTDVTHATPTAPGQAGHVIVCGLHGVGMRIIEQLHNAQVSVVIVDDSPEQRLVPAVRRLGVPYVAASPLSGDTLWQAGLAHALAVICVESEDLASLEVALFVRDLRPDVRVVTRMTNITVGAAVEQATGAGTVLSVPALAAPTFIEACLRVTTHELDVPGVSLVAVSVDADDAITLRERYGILAPVAIIPRDGGDMVVCPGRDHAVEPGDRVTLIGTTRDVADARLGVDAQERSAALIARRHAVRWLAGAARTWRSDAASALRVAVLLVMLLVITSTVILAIGYRVRQADGSTKHLPVIDALYFTLETVATVGFGDFSFSGQARWLETYGIVLITVGAIVVAALVALLTNFIVSRQIERSLGRTRDTPARGHVVIVGLGGVGVRVAEGLQAAGREVVIIDQDEHNRFASQVHDMGIPLIVGDATLASTLLAAGADRARAVAVLTSDDLVNIETGLAVHDVLGERRARVPVVLRVFDRGLAHTVGRSFGFRNVYSTADLAAPWFVASALGLDVRSSFYVADRPFLLGRLTVKTGGGLDGIAMADLDARTRVVALARARNNLTMEHPPRRDTRFDPGDEAYLVGPTEEITRVLRRDRAIVTTGGI